MHIEVPLKGLTQAELCFAQHERRFQLQIVVRGTRPSTGGLEPDLYFYFHDGGFLTLRTVEPITASAMRPQEWCSAYGLERRQLMLLAIYPMARLRLDPWTGGSGIALDPAGPAEALMVAARRILGIDPPGASG